MMLVFLICGALVAFCDCNSDIVSDEFVNGNIKFTSRVYKEIAKRQGNFIFSPLSIEVIFALTRAGAKGQTAQEFSDALNLPSDGVTKEALKNLLPTSSNQFELSTANKIYAGNGFKILDDFKVLATESYKAGIENLDFSQPKKAASKINQWVEKQTNNKIQKLINPDTLDATTKLVLVNALYFKGIWETPFKGHARKEPFHISKTDVQLTTMMTVRDNFKYAESLTHKAKFLELPYEGTNISMLVVLPNEVDGLQEIENQLERYLQPPRGFMENVNVKLPSFLTESEFDLIPVLQKLGLSTIFTPAADLSGISPEPLYVTKVVQKAFINVTTSGTEAAAATFMHFARSSRIGLTRKKFIADRPFFYFIKYNGVVLFAGRFVSN